MYTKWESWRQIYVKGYLFGRKKKSRGKAYGQYFKETIIGCKRDVLQGNNERDARRGMRVKPNKVNELWKVKYLPFTDYTATVADSAEKLKKPS